MPTDEGKGFFSHKIPQSEYRNAKDKSNDDRVELNTEIPKINIKEAEKAQLKAEISEKLIPVFANFFPDQEMGDLKEKLLNEQIYQKLGL